MTFDQAQGMFRTHKTYETACTYLVFASQRKADEATNQDTFCSLGTGEPARRKDLPARWRMPAFCELQGPPFA